MNIIKCLSLYCVFCPPSAAEKFFCGSRKIFGKFHRGASSGRGPGGAGARPGRYLHFPCYFSSGGAPPEADRARGRMPEGKFSPSARGRGRRSMIINKLFSEGGGAPRTEKKMKMQEKKFHTGKKLCYGKSQYERCFLTALPQAWS